MAPMRVWLTACPMPTPRAVDMTLLMKPPPAGAGAGATGACAGAWAGGAATGAGAERGTDEDELAVELLL